MTSIIRGAGPRADASTTPCASMKASALATAASVDDGIEALAVFSIAHSSAWPTTNAALSRPNRAAPRAACTRIRDTSERVLVVADTLLERMPPLGIAAVNLAPRRSDEDEPVVVRVFDRGQPALAFGRVERADERQALGQRAIEKDRRRDAPGCAVGLVHRASSACMNAAWSCHGVAVPSQSICSRTICRPISSTQ